MLTMVAAATIVRFPPVMCIASQVGEAVKRLTHYYLFQHSTISSNDKLICSRWFWFVESTDQHHTSIVTLTNRPFYIRHVELPYATDTVSLTTACGALWRQLQTHFVPRETSDQCTNMCCDSIVFFVVIPHMHFPVRKHVNNNIPKCHSYQCRLIRNLWKSITVVSSSINKSWSSKIGYIAPWNVWNSISAYLIFVAPPLNYGSP